MKAKNLAAAIVASFTLPIISAQAEPLIYGLQVEQFEYRFLEDETEVLAWDGDFIVGTDELKFVLRSEGEFKTDGDVMETMETQARLQVPISTFFDAVAGIRVDTPEGPDQVHGVIGVKGLAPQWFEVDAALFVSDHADVTARFEAEYDLLITQRLILQPLFELELAAQDIDERDIGAGLTGIELGLRLRYEFVREVAPYIGIAYERQLFRTADIARGAGHDVDSLAFVAGLRLFF